MGFYIWEDSTLNSNNYSPPAYVQFDKQTLPILDEIILKTKVSSHPELTEKQLKIGLLGLDKKMALEYFKPQADIIYKPITSLGSGSNINYNTNNYNLGLQLNVPILYRKERGNLQKIKASQEQSKWELEIK